MANQTKKERLAANFPGLVDLVLDDEGKEVLYLVKTPNGLETMKEYKSTGNEVLQPPSPELIPFELLRAKEVMDHTHGDDSALYWDMLNRLKTISVLPSEEYYHLVAAYIFSTYLQEAAPYFPYLWFFGPPERGKSRMVKAIARLSYRGLHTETLNPAYIFRHAEYFDGTLLIDVSDLFSRAKKKDSYDCY